MTRHLTLAEHGNTAQLGFDFDKRWEARRQRWVAPDRVFDPRGFAVDVLPGLAAKRFVVEHHYSGKYVATYLPVGLFRSTGGTGSELVGVAAFSVPQNTHSIPRYTGFAFEQGCELGRFVVRESVAYNGETWFLRRAMECLRAEKPQMRAVVSYADPVARALGGQVVKPEHYGTIYQASNATFVGRATARTNILASDGTIVGGRGLQKLRSLDKGWRYVLADLLRHGAPAPQPGEPMNAYVTRALEAPCFSRQRHPGNFTYLFALDDAARRQVAGLHGKGLPYPKKARAA